MTKLPRPAARLLAAALLLSAGSCGYNGPTEPLPVTGATLEGDVTYGGEKVPVALVVVRKVGGGGGASAFTDEDGHYRVLNAPLGPVQVGVNTGPTRAEMSLRARAASGSDTKASPKPAAKPIDLPAKFHNPESSGVTATVGAGVTKFDVALRK